MNVHVCVCMPRCVAARFAPALTDVVVLATWFVPELSQLSLRLESQVGKVHLAFMWVLGI